MNYKARISTANSLTHYGKKGMKWKKHKYVTPDGSEYEVSSNGQGTHITDEYGIHHEYGPDGSKKVYINYKNGSISETKDKNYRKYEVNKQQMSKSWDQVKNKNLTKGARIDAGKRLIKQGFSAVKNRVTGKHKNVSKRTEG